MKYVKFVLLAVLDLLFTLVCYITNPIVVLFADEVGELPWVLTWWANWDDHMDIDWMVYEHHVPRFAEYDFNRHYKYHDPEEALQRIGVYRGYVDLLDPNFTLKEKLQRYVCRVWWLYRNCGYGFSYYVTGVDIKPEDVKQIKTEEADGYTWYVTENAFCYKDERPSFLCLFWDNYVGWKFKFFDDPTNHYMLAFRITPFKK